MPKVTVAIPTYNRKKYLAECLDSILNQTFQDFNICVFDNCSDNYDIEYFLDEYKDRRIKLEKSAKNTGNYNRIYKYDFDTEYTVIFHDDDVMHPKMLEREMELMEKEKDLIYVGTNLNFISSHNKMTNFEQLPVICDKVIVDSPAQLVRMLLNDFDLAYDSVMYRTKHMEDISPYCDDFYKWNDRPYLIELTKKGRVGIILEKLVNYRLHPQQDSKADDSQKEVIKKSTINLFNNYKKNLGNKLNRKDARLFYKFTTTNIIQTAVSISNNLREYLKNIKYFRNKGFFRIRSLNPKAIIYGLRSIIKLS